MSRWVVHIDALRVRAKRVPAGKARAVALGLGEAIAGALAGRGLTPRGRPDARIPQADLGRIAGDGRQSARISAEIASRVADLVAGRAEPKA
jgi:hypothetical protein